MHPAERVVVDTNVFVSRLLRFDSVPGRAAEKAIHQAVLLVSQPTMSELADVLAQAKFDRYVSIEQRLQFIRLIAHTAHFVPIVHPIRECRDPKDDKFLDVALNGRADVIVTGDVDLLRMHQWREIAILTPAKYLGR
ncbi:MAG: putative toxin-antitoxin system toxin component, PIN family [Candidatus Sulfotelmatobacter sp.]|jgi:putative PIN family toxin of toxin-antitoxin system